MKPKTIIKLAVDLSMTIVYLLAMAYTITGNAVHEISGALLFVLFLVHNILNRNWYKSIFKGKYTITRFLNTTVNMLLLLSVICIAISALMISQTLFPAMNFGSAAFGRILHSVSAYWGFVLLALHLGFHWGMIVKAFRNMAKNQNTRLIHTVVIRCVAIFAAGYGVYAFTTREIWQKLTISSMYPIWKDGDHLMWFFSDFTAVITLIVFITYYSHKMLCKKDNRAN